MYIFLLDLITIIVLIATVFSPSILRSPPYNGVFLMCDTIYYLIIAIYHFWYFYVKNVILDLGDLFPYFKVHLMFFRSNLIHDMVRYQL